MHSPVTSGTRRLAALGEAFEKAEKAVEKNDPEAWDFLGWLHESGRGTPRDLDSAKFAYTRAEEGGIVEGL